MKKKILAYFSGVFATVLVLTMVTTAIAASGKATFNFVNVSLRGERNIAAGAGKRRTLYFSGIFYYP